MIDPGRGWAYPPPFTKTGSPLLLRTLLAGLAGYWPAGGDPPPRAAPEVASRCSAILPGPCQVSHDRARPRVGLRRPLHGNRHLTSGNDADRRARGLLGRRAARDQPDLPAHRLLRRG